MTQVLENVCPFLLGLVAGYALAGAVWMLVMAMKAIGL